MIDYIRIGERIRWPYTHHLNSRSSVQRTKVGVYIGRSYYINKSNGKRYVHPLLVKVKFDSNKGFSRVAKTELVRE